MGIFSKLFRKEPPKLLERPFEQLNENINFVTDTATLAIFDPEVLQHRLLDESDWWSQNFSTYEEVSQGLISLVSLSFDGFYKVRFTSDLELNDNEKKSIKKIISPLGIKVISGNLFIGAGECLPGDNYTPLIDSIEEDQGVFYVIPPGDYDLTLTALESATAHNAPIHHRIPDLVIQIHKRSKPFLGVKEEPRFFNI